MTWNGNADAVGFFRSTLCGAQQRGRRGYFRFRPAVLPPVGSLSVADWMTVLASSSGNPDEQLDPGTWCR